jgi:hypothetical protein
MRSRSSRLTMENACLYIDRAPAIDSTRQFTPVTESLNRQFRLPMCLKLSDLSRTGLGLPGPPLLSTFGRACISKLEADSWLVPEESIPAVISNGCSM